MAHNKIESEEPQQPEPGQDEPPQQESGTVNGPESGQEPGPESAQEPGAPSGPWENPSRPPSPSGFNPDYWPKY